MKTKEPRLKPRLRQAHVLRSTAQYEAAVGHVHPPGFSGARVGRSGREWYAFA